MAGVDEYDDAVRYDAEYGGIDDAARFFLSLAEGCGRRVLDLGCGTGRLSLPLARLGKEVTGLDRSPAISAATISTANSISSLLAAMPSRPFLRRRTS